jgi:DNA uptake protein ComE-like DNA-binding protein
MSVVNINNTASKQELMTIREKGEARAKLIITARDNIVCNNCQTPT